MFKFTNDRFKKKMKSEFKSKAVAINDLTDKQFTVDDLYVAFKKGFETGLNMHTTEYRLTEKDKEELEILIENYKSRSEEHTSELQSRFDLVCRLLLEK